MVLNRQHLERELQEVTQQLSCPEQLSGLSLNLFETLPSTNQTLWELLDQGATIPTVIIAEQQTAGRGQWGRKWQSDKGGLYLSLALTANLPASNSTQLTLCSAWGIAKALKSYGIPVLLKWLNDLLLEGRKLGGILTETRVQQGEITKAVIGVGINWSNSVPESGINLQSFFEEHPSISAITSLEMLAAIIIQGLLFGYQCWSEEGTETLLSSYQELLHSRGRRVIVDGTPGTVIGITPTGELRVGLNTQVPASSGLTEIHLKPGTISLDYF
ncbi:MULTISPECIES: biotin--[acetyl-CoA-carboxylase] ligase [unclassified Coleofasciculus]|uniref:biotin--[acetyl-CoA-carboxylase] ligase n=1 Tax=unclassified Coleofasciculus TaxID=2692782 RepID=UPI00187EA934|nr:MULTISPECIES: biotin--[acetyl-CoA-carboxylase] ligase [unclassified Coleofasciculus]MBE9124646.1 biotin--[acetyl-CoA-carboxylase] ligase [Coleofasciculus sp. LEGE 07081]MBE9147610.1 biotin--[acetyl-CoA-carboxylase] ligase [Coleofasciculus sp. LEGE 07092]